MYLGIGPEAGKRVKEYDAFSYACERCLTGTEEEHRVFLEIAKNSKNMLEFASNLVEWFYSGNWLNDTARGQETLYLIRLEGNPPRSFFGTYMDALKSGYEEAREKNVEFCIAV